MAQAHFILNSKRAVMAGLSPTSHVFYAAAPRKEWIAGTQGPA